jgi:hypothetical protein
MMNANPGGDFKWDELLGGIGRQNVIPVLGSGLYTVRTPDAGDVLLFPYLAKKFAEKTGLSTGDGTPSFASIVFRYLEKNPDDYLGFFLTVPVFLRGKGSLMQAYPEDSKKETGS